MKCQTTFEGTFTVFPQMHVGILLQILETVCFRFWPDFLASKKPCLMILSILKEKEIIFLHNGLHV